jgi:hypothetical protein
MGMQITRTVLELRKSVRAKRVLITCQHLTSGRTGTGLVVLQSLRTLLTSRERGSLPRHVAIEDVPPNDPRLEIDRSKPAFLLMVCFRRQPSAIQSCRHKQ